MKKVIIDPRSNYSYGSFYLYGLEVLVGKKHISYNLKPFIELNDLGNDLRFIVVEGNIKTKYFIHTNDSYKLSEEDYNWCDVYGCVNANFAHYPQELYPKLISLVPSFAIRKDASLLKCVKDAIFVFLSTYNHVLIRKRME